MMSAQFTPTPHVRSVVHGDRTVLLDLRRERYYSLDEVGTRVWALIADSADVATIVARIAEEFDAPHEQIERDVHALLHRLENKLKVIVPVPAAPVAREPSGLNCAWTLAATTAALRILGLRRTLKYAERIARRATHGIEPSDEFLANVVRRVDTAAAFFPGRALCLEQSLTLYICFRRAGIAADLRIGAQPYPFAAHAWVEYQGNPVGTSYDDIGKFVPFERLAEAV